MYSIILVSHIIISIVLICLTLYIVGRSCAGMFKKVLFSQFHDIKLPIFTVSLLYLELILGLLLYALYISRLGNLITQENGYEYFAARFWAIEHVILMFFAIIFGHLGLVYAKNLTLDTQKFKKIFLYFGLSMVLIIISIAMNIFRNA